MESREAGKLLKNLGYTFDVVYTSMLERATKTSDLILEEMGLSDQVEVNKHWKINERHYGSLQGSDKKEMAEVHGKEQVNLWRQSYDNPPPQIHYDHDFHPRFDPMYANFTEEEHKQMPQGESLKMVRQRVTPYWEEHIIPRIKAGKSIMLVAHEHVLRGMVQTLTGMDNESIMKLRLPNAAPFVFEFKISEIGNDVDAKLKNYYIQDEEKAVSL